MRNVDLYFLDKEEPHKGCLLALRNCILSKDPHVTETQKYGMPCYCFKGKAFCYLWTDKKTHYPYILFVEGQYLNHQRLETGKRARMKIFPVDPKKDLPLKQSMPCCKMPCYLIRMALFPLNKISAELSELE